MRLYRDQAGNLVDEDYASRHPDTTTFDDHPFSAIARTLSRIDNDTLSLRADIAVIKATHDSDMRMLRSDIAVIKATHESDMRTLRARISKLEGKR